MHFEAGYVPPHHSIASFAQAIRAIGEPIHNRTAEQISMANLFMLLFEITGLFDMRTRPELLLLQKTMVVVEGVARSLDPKLDIWATAEPIVREWIDGISGRSEAWKARGRHERDQACCGAGAFASHARRLADRATRCHYSQWAPAGSGNGCGDRAGRARRNRASAVALWLIVALLAWLVLIGL